MPLASGARLGPYEILAPLAAGGMGEVYRARDDRLGREVAVKVLPAELAADADRLRRFEHEARAAGAVNHPNVLAIFDTGVEAGLPYLVTELLEGTTLRDELRRGRLPERTALDWARQLAEGLAAAHRRGILHRDLKPENVFLTRAGRVKILDFGLAKLDRAAGASAPESLATASLTAADVVLGTPGYMSPEQLSGLPVDARSDLFAFGAILYEMLAGRRAFQGSTAADLMTAALRDDPPAFAAASALGGTLERLARRCLEKEPGRRFQSAGDLLFALEAVSEGRAATAPASRPTRSLAVLPFRDLAEDPGNAHLPLGLADAIITELASLRSLTVRPTAAILRGRDRRLGPEEAARELAVDAVLDGSFQRAGSRLRITMQLVDAAAGEPLWAGKVDGSLDDLFAMQDQVARRVAEALAVEVTPGRPGRAAPREQPAAGAQELCLEGRSCLARETLADTRAAIDCFERARDLDPQFPEVWTGLADAYMRMAYTFEPAGDWYGRAEEMAGHALALDPDLPEGRYLRSRLLWSPRAGFDNAGALRELAAALAARPGLGVAHYWLGTILLHLSLGAEAAAALERALEIDPGDHLALVMLGYARFLDGSLREALALTERAVAKVATPWGHYQLALCEIQLGDLGAAERRMRVGAAEAPGNVLLPSLHGLLAALRGDAAAARAAIRRVEEDRQAFGHYHHAQYDIACIHALLGEPDAALAALEAASRNGFPCHRFFAYDRLLAPLRYDERFSRLLRELAAECEGYRRVYQAAFGHPTSR